MHEWGEKKVETTAASVASLKISTSSHFGTYVPTLRSPEEMMGIGVPSGWANDREEEDAAAAAFSAFAALDFATKSARSD